MTALFNTYDDKGYRLNIAGCRSSRIEDEAILYNLRYRWSKELTKMSDIEVINAYDEFAMSSWFGNNDERFLEWLGL